MENHAVTLVLQTPPDSHDEDPSKRRRRPSRIQTGFNTGVAIQVQMTPPATPASPQDTVESQPPQGLFHNYLRAFYPFDPMATLTVSDDSLLMTISLQPGDLILVHSVHANGWADGTVLTSGERGWLPTNYCEAYDHPYLGNLLNAMTQFWDLLEESEDTNLSTFVRQDYIRGLIAGVRYLLEHTDCLHRDALLVQQHTGIRRMRKGLLADLSTLVQIAKNLQETLSEPFAGDVIHYLLEDVMTKAYNVVTRAVGFVDMWTKEAAENRRAISEPHGRQDPTTPLNVQRLTIDTGVSLQAGTRDLIDSAKYFPAAANGRDGEHATASAEGEHNSAYARATPFSTAFSSRNNSVAHRLSLVKPERAACSLLASEKLAEIHDTCISHIGAFIGHHLHSRPSSEMVETTERIVKACKSMLAVVDAVYIHGAQRSTLIWQARVDFQMRLEDLINATKGVFNFSDRDDGNVVIMPAQSNRLITVATSLIRTAGECASRTRILIEQIGNFEINTLPGPVANTEEANGTAIQSLRQPAQPQSEGESRKLTSLEKRLSGKMLPPPPRLHQGASSAIDTFDFALDSPAGVSDIGTPVTPFSAGPQKVLPPLPTQRGSAARLSQATAISGATLRSRRSSRVAAVSPVRKDSVGISIAGSADTFRSGTRDSGISVVSEVSTRATTPDHTKEPISPDPALLSSFNSLSSIRSSTTDAELEAETRLLQRTYATELTFNKDGQVSGGSLPALVEQLTTHDAAPDPVFVSSFFITFRMFTTPREFAGELIARFEYIGDSKTVGAPVRLRIYNMFKGWLETYWNAEADKLALGDIRYFALRILKPHLPCAGERLHDLLRKVSASYHNGTIAGPLVSGVGKTSMSISSHQQAGRSTPEPAVTRSQLGALRTAVAGGPQCNVLELDTLELARQITLITSKIYCDIRPEELLSLEWNMKGTRIARNVRNMSALNTDLANVVGDSILAPDDAKKRALVIKHWSKVAFHLLELNNYDTLMAIMCTINSSVVMRLKRTWELVSRKTKGRLSDINAVIDHSRNYASLRRRLEQPVAPCIPFVGIYLTDLTFLDAGNPRRRELPGTASGKPVSVINFDKYARMAKVVSFLQKFQVPYKLQAVPEMQAWMDAHLQRMRVSNEEMVTEFHRRSLIIEPKRGDPRAPRPAESKKGDDALCPEERPKTASGKERLETFLRHNTFSFKSLMDVQDMPTADAGAERQN
ncbi:hypothetical protein LTR65_008461 [Meristemomyces frigidus]